MEGIVEIFRKQTLFSSLPFSSFYFAHVLSPRTLRRRASDLSGAFRYILCAEACGAEVGVHWTK